MLQRQSSQHTWREAHVSMTLSAVACPAAFYAGTDERISKPNLGTRWRC